MAEVHYGYRSLRTGERIPEGCEFHRTVSVNPDGTLVREWVPSRCAGGLASDPTLYRVPRKAPKSPRKAPVVQETSLQAHRSQKDKGPTDQMKILACIRKYRTGISCDRLEGLLGMRHQTLSARVRDLAIRGLIVDSGRREKTATGRKAICWKAVG